MATRNLKEYVDEIKDIGPMKFRYQYQTPVLIGLGILGDLKDRGFRSEGSTFLVDAPDVSDGLQAGMLVDRVWRIRRRMRNRRADQITVGRTSENDVVIPEYSLSGTHCAFQYDAQGIHVIDLDSTNGTLVNDESIVPRQLYQLTGGEKIAIGRFQFEFLTAQGFLLKVATMAGIRTS